MRDSLSIATLCCALAMAAPQAEAQRDCPPGLAKKSPACVPPGQAKKAWRRGDVLQGDYVIIRDRDRYGLPPLGPGERYYRMGDDVLVVNEQTRQILDIIALATLLVQ